ncbi:DUF3006 domain-containing protein [Rummeliibacillus sp. G93]|uniref:DUF3006 domain-containing protein n=1 Tax=Rummeliibacillus sp. G93 TaxID=2939494 RepID=UPI00201BAB9B|nr:DUF3006 domain-containing protein [Rummeliibacillus sp. G93]UQW96088.1 DUF3006 domain-containing protein [Rummeliibacillus sp. G93]
MQKGVVERFKGELAVIEIDGVTVNYPKKLLPKEVQVGDLLIIENDTISIDADGTKRLKIEIDNLADELFEE